MKRSSFHPKAFTLIELLVAVAVLALMVSLLLQMIGMSSSIMTNSSKKLDGLAGARLALDRVGYDMASRVRDKELNCLFEKHTGSDTFGFYSEVDAYSADRKMTAVGYRIQEDDDTRLYQLERGVKGGNWADGYPQAAPVMADLEYDVLAEGVLRMEFSYLKKNGQLVVNQNLSDFSDVAAIVVTVAVLDSSSRKMLTEAELRTLAGLFTDPVSAPASPTAPNLASTWEAELQASNLPRRAIQNVRFFERFYYVR